MFEHQDKALQILAKMVDEYSSHNRYNTLKEMDDKAFNTLRVSLPHVMFKARELERNVKAEWIDRHTDYEKYVRHAKKHFNDLDIAILELLYGNDEGAYYYRGIENHISEESTDAAVDGGTSNKAAVRASVKKLKRRGLVIHALGLFDEDGFTAGSGFMANDRRRDTIEQIINNYRVEQGELGLKI